MIGNVADNQLNLLMKKLQQVPGYIPEALAAAVPTVEVLLSHASTTSPVERKANDFAPRSYNVDDETQQRIDDNTVVGVEGTSIRVGLGTGSVHERPLVPLGSLPLKWRGAIAQKVNGYIRQRLALNTATAFLQGALAGGPVAAYGFNRRAREAGVKLRALKEAKSQLGVRTVGKGKKAVLTR